MSEEDKKVSLLCELCGHSLEDNSHGFDQNDATMNGDKLVHSGHCTYCRICNPTIFGLPSAQDLDAVAEEQAIADATVNRLNSCITCGADATHICTTCGQDFCASHDCVMHSNHYATQDEPLIDDEGEQHRGRKIRLIGEGWPNSLRMIKDMSDEELENQINGLQNLLKDAIRTADYARISISAREYELDYRKHSRYVAAIKRREKLQQGSVRLNAKRHQPGGGPAIPPLIKNLMTAFNITYEVAIKLAEAMKKV